MHHIILMSLIYIHSNNFFLLTKPALNTRRAFGMTLLLSSSFSWLSEVALRLSHLLLRFLSCEIEQLSWVELSSSLFERFLVCVHWFYIFYFGELSVFGSIDDINFNVERYSSTFSFIIQQQSKRENLSFSESSSFLSSDCGFLLYWLQEVKERSPIWTVESGLWYHWFIRLNLDFYENNQLMMSWDFSLPSFLLSLFVRDIYRQKKFKNARIDLILKATGRREQRDIKFFTFDIFCSMFW